MSIVLRSLCFCVFLVFPAVVQSQPADGSFSISGGGGQTSANGGDRPLGVGYARILAEAGSVGPGGVAVIEFRDSDGVLISELAVPAVEPVYQGRFFADVGGAVTTVLAIANPNDAAATFEFYFTDVEGVPFGNGSLVLEPGEQFASFLDQEPFGSGASFAGTLTFDSSVPVAVSAIRGFTNEAGEFLMSRLPVSPLNSASSNPVYFPYFAAGGGWASEIVLVNPSAGTMTGTIEFVGRDGAAAVAPGVGGGYSARYAVPPRGFRRFADGDRSGDIRLGLVKAVPDAGSAAPGGHVLSSLADGGKTVAETAVSAMLPGSAFRVYAEMSGEAGEPESVRLGLALANTRAEWNTVTLELAALDGIPVAAPATLALPPSGHRFVMLDELFSLPDPRSGVLRVSSETDVAVAAVRFVVNGRGETKITATPPVAELSAAGGETYFPLAVELEGWSTRYLLFDRTAYQGASGRLDIYDQAGRHVAAGRTVDPVPGVGGDFSYAGRVRLDCEDCGSVDDATVVLSGQETLRTARPGEDGRFEFFGLEAGRYAVQIRKPGFRGPPSREIRILEDGTVSTTQDSTFALLPLDPELFEFHWEEDQSIAGHDYASHVNEPVEIEILGEQAAMADGASANRLLRDYNIALVDQDDRIWTHEHAYRLLRTMGTIPQELRDPYGPQSLPASRWLIASGHVADDVRISTDGDGVRTVWISPEVFVNANPKIALFEGKRGSYFSQRLHHAAVRFVTDNGKDERAYEKILQERYGVTTEIGDDADYRALTGEPASRFQAFHAEEIVQIINTFEEMPAGMRAAPGLDLLVRRLDGTDNPHNPQAPAIAWVDSGYVEFMEKAFNTGSISYVHRLILHEKAHFLWGHLFDDRLKDDWIELGGWFRDPNDPDSWSTTNQTEFVSAYAHGVNPNEDMAESISYFVVNPDLLRSRSPGKYEFVRDRIMGGTFYISQIREDLTFRVYNLYPDYVFPGKIREVRISARGGPGEDKLITVEIGLHAMDAALEGASEAFTRIHSEIGTFFDLRLYPVDGGGSTGTVLSGSFTASKYVKSGYWANDKIEIYDEHGNARLHGVNDFGWSLYLNNPLEDVTPPDYVANSASLTVESGHMEGREVQFIEASWQVNETPETIAESNACLAALNDDNAATYSFQQWGSYDQQENQCRVNFVMPHYMPSSAYVLAFVRSKDKARNESVAYFRHPGFDSSNRTPLRHETFLDETAPVVQLTSLNPDLDPPELDISNIRIDGTPTRPDDPNGETLVTLEFSVRDNISGFMQASLHLRDPQGLEHFFYVIPPDRENLFPAGDPSKWATQDWSVLLPAGSAPGIWGLAEMTVWDRAQNFRQHDFTEVFRFEVE